MQARDVLRLSLPALRLVGDVIWGITGEREYMRPGEKRHRDGDRERWIESESEALVRSV